MILAAWFGGGLVAAAALWLAFEPTWEQPLFTRQNYRGREVPTAGGVAAVVAVAAVAGGHALFASRGLAPGVAATVVAVAGFGLLGALDDLAGDDDRKGFRGHLAALVGGRLTTGGLKLAGGLAVAACAVGMLGDRARPVDVLVVAAAANLGNLFDRAPGRVAKVAVIAFGALVGIGGSAEVAGAALATGAVVGLFPFDLRERLMLGDAGANAAGAALGLGAVMAAETTAAAAVTLAVLVALNLASEFVSFSRVIAAVGPLRWLDRAGRAKVEA